MPPATDHYKVLKEVFGYDTFRDGQEHIISSLMADCNVLAVMPTGSGKSLCFQIPALLKPGVTVVVSPLVALMHDQVAGLQLLGAPAGTINSARESFENAETWEQVRQGDIKLLYVSPERLMREQTLEALEHVDLSMFVVDEAHCISQWGASFRPEYQALEQLRARFPGIPISAFTATADEVTREDIVARLFGGAAETVVHGFDRPNISLAVTAKSNWKRQLQALLAKHQGDSGIVYCLSRKKTDETAAMLNGLGLRALPYHAGMEKARRDANQNAFMTEPGLIMVATIAFGMGIDKPDVRFVIHVDMPGSIEAYYQEFGRAGRDGDPASAIMLYGMNDMRMRRVFIDEANASEEHKRREHKRLDALLAYCESPTCRRVALLKYFSEAAEPCGNCDICRDPVALADGTQEGQKALSAVYRTGQRYGVAHIVDVLRGNATDKVTKAMHNRLPTFGVGAERKKSEWQSLIRQLVAADFLQIDIKGYGGLTITEKGVDLLKGKVDFHYRPETVKRERPPRAKSRTESSTAPQPTPLDETGHDLLQRLKALRLQLASERNVPAYVIFPDRTLIELAAQCPQDHLSFSQIHGVGAKKLEQFADIFIAEIRAGA